MKILVCCGNGLGSSFMIEINVENALKKLGIEGVDLSHSDLGSAKGINADLYIATLDIAPELESLGKPVISLSNILAVDELEAKLQAFFEEHPIN